MILFLFLLKHRLWVQVMWGIILPNFFSVQIQHSKRITGTQCGFLQPLPGYYQYFGGGGGGGGVNKCCSRILHGDPSGARILDLWIRNLRY